MPEYVNQHKHLAMTGKPGQKAPSMPKKSSVMNDPGTPSGASDARRGSYKVPKHQMGK